MEIPEIGNNCSFESCNQLDFLPIKCDYCLKIFCKNHNFVDNHNCTAKPLNFVKDGNNTVPLKHLCSLADCKNSELTPIICHHCSKNFCLKHRHQVDHDCIEYKPPTNPMAEAAAKIAELTKSMGNPVKNVKKIKNDKLASKVQLMKLKGKAVGNKELPYEEKLFFSVMLPQTEAIKVENPLALFVSHHWSVGRAIDAIAELGKVPNRNNEGNAPVLRLFRSSDGKRIHPLDVTLKEFVDKEEIFNGQSLILESVNKNTEYLKL